jgi:hypothetical protein
MKTFKDLEFTSHFAGIEYGVMSRLYFENGYGVSIVKTPHSYGSDDGLYELAVLKNESGSLIKEAGVFEEQWELCYTTPITDDVMGYLSPEDVTDVMTKIQKL